MVVSGGIGNRCATRLYDCGGLICSYAIMIFIWAMWIIGNFICDFGWQQIQMSQAISVNVGGLDPVADFDKLSGQCTILNVTHEEQEESSAYSSSDGRIGSGRCGRCSGFWSWWTCVRCDVRCGGPGPTNRDTDYREEVDDKDCYTHTRSNQHGTRYYPPTYYRTCYDKYTTYYTTEDPRYVDQYSIPAELLKRNAFRCQRDRNVRSMTYEEFQNDNFDFDSNGCQPEIDQAGFDHPCSESYVCDDCSAADGKMCDGAGLTHFQASQDEPDVYHVHKTSFGCPGSIDSNGRSVAAPLRRVGTRHDCWVMKSPGDPPNYYCTNKECILFEDPEHLIGEQIEVANGHWYTGVMSLSLGLCLIITGFICCAGLSCRSLLGSRSDCFLPDCFAKSVSKIRYGEWQFERLYRNKEDDQGDEGIIDQERWNNLLPEYQEKYEKIQHTFPPGERDDTQ